MTRRITSIAALLRRGRTADGAGLAQRLALPQLASAFREVTLEFFQGYGQRAALARRPQARVDLVEASVRSDVGHDFDDPLPQLAEEMLVAGDVAATTAFVVLRLSIGIEEEHHVEITVVVRFASTEFAQCDDRPAAFCLLFMLPLLERPPVFLDQAVVFPRGNLLQADFGDVRQGPVRVAQIFLPQNVAHSHAQVLEALEAVQNRVDVFRSPAQVLQRRLQGLVGGQLVQHQRIHQFVDHARIARENARQIRARGTQPDIQPQRGRVEAEQFPQHPFAAQRVTHLAQVDQRGIGIRRLGDGLEQVGGDGGQEMAAAPRGEERHAFGRQRHQVVVGARHIAKTIPLQALLDRLGAGRRVQDQVGFGGGRRILAKGVVQQVVEDPAIELGVFPQVAFEFVQRAMATVIGIARADGQPSQFLVAVRAACGS